MAALKTTPVVIVRADQPAIVQKFLSTAERFLFNPTTATKAITTKLCQHPLLRSNVEAVK